MTVKSMEHAYEGSAPEFSRHIFASICDGTGPVFSPDRLREVESGYAVDHDSQRILSPATFLINGLLEPAKQVLTNGVATDEDSEAQATRLRHRLSTFVPITAEYADMRFWKTARQFGEEPGLIVQPTGWDTVAWMSAVRDGSDIRRIVRTSRIVDDPSDYARRLSIIGPATEGSTLDDGTVYAVEFKQDVPTPRKITPTQLEDWLERVARSGLIPRSMSLDVGVDDSSLDNFKIDPDGSLRYIDGDFATFIKASDEQLQESLKEQRSQLQPYVRDLGQVGLENPLYFTDEHATILESMGPNRPVIADQPSPSNVSSLQDPKKDWWTV